MTELITNIKNRTTDTVASYISSLCYGFGCPEKSTEELATNQLYLDILQRHQAAGPNSCLSPEALAKIEQALTKPCKSQLADCKVDDSKVAEWQFRFKDCTGHESWERWLHWVCTTISVETTFKEDKKLQYEFDLIRTSVPKCDLTFDTYKKLIACNISAEVIRESVQCGVSFEINDRQINCKIEEK